MIPVTLPVLGLAVLVDGSHTPSAPGGYDRHGDPYPPEPEDFCVRRIVVAAKFAPGEQAPELEWDGLLLRDQDAIEDALRCGEGSW